MKRKLNKNDEPVAAVPEPEIKPATPAKPTKAAKTDPEKKQKEAEPSFAELGLDPRLVQAVAKQSFEKPTLVQRKAIPLALQGQDVLCKAKTGSGKTAAYVLPLLSGILRRKTVCATRTSFFLRRAVEPWVLTNSRRPTPPSSPPPSSSSRRASSPTKSSKPSGSYRPFAPRTSTPPS